MVGRLLSAGPIAIWLSADAEKHGLSWSGRPVIAEHFDETLHMLVKKNHLTSPTSALVVV